MTKPVVFFSHSSRDELVLRGLKTRLLEITGATIEVFLSSDGQSIPLGRNWVSKVERALEESAIMLVFLSPNSIQGHWLYFEAGFSYGRGIRVIPVGLPGLDLETLGPPISLLQGFNIRSPDGLNNIIAVINEEFHFGHPPSFTESDFDALTGYLPGDAPSPLGTHAQHMGTVIVLATKLPDDCCDTAQSYLQETSIPYQARGQELSTHGLSLNFHHKNFFEARIDPLLAGHTFPIVDGLLARLGPGPSALDKVQLFFSPWVSLVPERFRLTSRMFGTEILLNLDGTFSFRGFVFNLDREWRRVGLDDRAPAPYLTISAPGRALGDIPFADLLALIFSVGALAFLEDFR